MNKRFKKILSTVMSVIMTIGIVAVGSVSAFADDNVCTFADGKPSNTNYTFTDCKYKTSDISVEYNETTYTAALKMESSTSVSFTAATTGNLTIVTDQTSSGKRIKVDNVVKTTDENGVVTVSLSSGTHTITKGETMNVVYISYSGTLGSSTIAEYTVSGTYSPAAATVSVSPSTNASVAYADGNFSLTATVAATLSVSSDDYITYTSAEYSSSASDVAISLTSVATTDDDTNTLSYTQFTSGNSRLKKSYTVNGFTLSPDTDSYVDLQGTIGGTAYNRFQAPVGTTISYTPASNGVITVEGASASSTNNGGYSVTSTVTDEIADVAYTSTSTATNSFDVISGNTYTITVAENMVNIKSVKFAATKSLTEIEAGSYTAAQMEASDSVYFDNSNLTVSSTGKYSGGYVKLKLKDNANIIIQGKCGSGTNGRAGSVSIGDETVNIITGTTDNATSFSNYIFKDVQKGIVQINFGNTGGGTFQLANIIVSYSDTIANDKYSPETTASAVVSNDGNFYAVYVVPSSNVKSYNKAKLQLESEDIDGTETATVYNEIQIGDNTYTAADFGGSQGDYVYGVNVTDVTNVANTFAKKINNSVVAFE